MTPLRRTDDHVGVLGAGLMFGFVVFVAGLLIAFGLMGGSNPPLIGAGFVLFAACAIFGTQPHFMNPKRDSND